LLSLAILAVPVIIAAQSPSNPSATNGNSATLTVIAPDGTTKTTTVTIHVDSCPVAMRAKQGSSSGLVKVRRDHPDDGKSLLSPKPGQQIHLILGKMQGADFGDPAQIAGATVTVKGLSGRERLDRSLDLTSDGFSDLRRTVNVRFSTENDGSVSADLGLPGFTSVNSIKLDSLDLKDGSTWTLASLKACIVTPDRIMLVASQ
jgi:hypothetical protein